ncbi:uncharacterized protein [Montipora foliosa]|uniref:uncharacterized protein isoform X1 n=1 Tax=Montipora foliosa TaxID=591990 RepID=UPI0035F2083A
MADCSRTVVAMARFLAIAHIVVGSLLIIFGIAYSVRTGTSWGLIIGIVIGAWMCVTGALGIPGSRYERSFSRNCFAGVFMGFSITSALTGALIISFCSVNVSPEVDEMGLTVILLILGIVEFVMGIWAPICLCVMKPCCGPAQGTTGGVQVSFPVHPDGGVLPVQASYMYAQGMQATSAQRPIGALGGPPPQFVVAAAPVGAGLPQETAQLGKYIPL